MVFRNCFRGKVLDEARDQFRDQFTAELDNAARPILSEDESTALVAERSIIVLQNPRKFASARNRL